MTRNSQRVKRKTLNVATVGGFFVFMLNTFLTVKTIIVLTSPESQGIVLVVVTIGYYKRPMK